uniref:Uncharacterized protein n=1 Tax=viral metagenome TaxID=1070528 RepID=A0A6C0EG48_9ZZZZ
MLANESHPAKAESPMLVTDVGIAMLANEVHPSKAESPMMVTDNGIITSFNVSFSTPHPAHELSVMVMVPAGT